jgi:hypothetical protein
MPQLGTSGSVGGAARNRRADPARFPSPFGTVEEIAIAALFFSRPEQQHINSHILTVDGCRTATAYPLPKSLILFAHHLRQES